LCQSTDRGRKSRTLTRRYARMLSLSLKLHEDVVLTLEDGRTIEVMLIESRRDEARLAFRADRSIRIDRREVHERRKAEGSPPQDAAG
jgi:sRNA-binding carbon storage regulator CsrA